MRCLFVMNAKSDMVYIAHRSRGTLSVPLLLVVSLYQALDAVVRI